MSILSLIFICSFKAEAFFKDIADASERAGAVTAIAEATVDLYSEFDPNDTLAKEVKNLSKKQDHLSREANSLSYLSKEIVEFLKAPDLSKKRLENSIRATTSFIRKGKGLAASVAALGPQSSSAVANLQTSSTLNNILANQTAQMTEEKRDRLSKISAELTEQQESEEFIKKHRKMRRVY